MTRHQPDGESARVYPVVLYATLPQTKTAQKERFCSLNLERLGGRVPKEAAMSKRYSQEEKDQALARLVANTNDVPLTSAQTGIPVRTLHAWRRAHLASEQYAAQQQQQVKLASSDDEALRLLRQQLVSEALSFIASLEEVIDDATLNQRVSALGQLIDRIVKLAVLLPPAQTEQVLRIEYADPATMEDTVP